MTAPPISEEGRALLDELARRRPGPARADANWAALQRRLGEAPRLSLVEEGDDAFEAASRVDGHRSSAAWSRWIASAAISVAIAAAVLLALRVVVGGGQRVEAETVGVSTQAADAAQGKAGAAAKTRAAAQAIPRESASRPPVADEPAPPAAAPATTASPTAKSSAASPTTPRAAAPTSASQLAEETKLLADARRALAEERFGEAVEITARHRTQFPEGALREELRAIEAIAACRGGKGTTAARTFSKAYPSSPHLPRVRAACPAG